MDHRGVINAAVAELWRRVAAADADLTELARHFERAVVMACLQWSLSAERWFDGGAAAPTLLVRRRDGSSGVLKVARPGDLDAAVSVMQAAAGRGYARVFAWDAGLGAVLLEQLGPDLWQSDRTVAGQVAVTVPLLREAWTIPVESGSPYVSKAAGLLGILRDLGPRYGADHPEALARATSYAELLAQTERPEVVCHGDPHAGNVLRRDEGWALIDPDGFVGERAYDCGVVLRDACREIAAAEAVRTGAGRDLLWHGCGEAARLTGLDLDRIWMWSYVERVTTGLYLAMLGHPEESRSFLDSALLLARPQE